MDPQSAAEVLTRHTGEPYRFSHQLDGGAVGADLFRDRSENSWVIKWVNDSGAVHRRSSGVVFSERLRTAAGWPAPERHVVHAEGWLFVLQQFVPGETVEVVTPVLLDAIEGIHERRLGLARPDDDRNDFADHLIETLTVGGTGYCVHEPLRNYSARSRAFLEQTQAVGAELSRHDLSANDVIHWDLHPGNLIQRGDALAAVIDTDHAKAGDGRFDLATLALTVLDRRHDKRVVERLHAIGITPLDDAAHAAFLSHMFLRLIGWTLHRDATEEAEFWLDQADRLL